ncbi:hypothetical protein BO94DRAFT_579703 [Aspergillus sclerotioniger CBS 115572]|uniref:Rhodopsin domain-containing protein n=1 Tax=Aspergillus sclerotioniger CBS 115572 TaxID=1450535 RepID=A0A317V2D0_9EURO|nr:hypothetical protein BO94DRAFT_579703 [Aspergillus sclerotioniger CBS 115572]PWY66360.1 hypothetical protein BO94DRAFT_579703 [Aspergillus sclerotioniger CBS 115572]
MIVTIEHHLGLSDNVHQRAIHFLRSPSAVLAAAIALPCVGTFSVCVRLALRWKMERSIGVDDWLILAALVFVIGMGAVQIYGVVEDALGYPTPPFASEEAELTELSSAQRIVELVDWITWVLMTPANGLIKLSSLFLYRRIFAVGHERVFGMVSWALIGLCALWTLAFFFATIFGCGRHLAYPWGPLGEIGSCNTNARLEAMMITDLITDVLVWVLPVPMVWRTQMKFERKVAATSVLLLATISLAAAVVRLIVQGQISNGGYAAHTDVDQTLTILLYWSMIESGLALIASCLPTMRLQTAWKKACSAFVQRPEMTLPSSHDMTPAEGSGRKGRMSISLGSTLVQQKSHSSQFVPLIEVGRFKGHGSDEEAGRAT